MQCTGGSGRRPESMSRKWSVSARSGCDSCLRFLFVSALDDEAFSRHLHDILHEFIGWRQIRQLDHFFFGSYRAPWPALMRRIISAPNYDVP